MEGLLKAVKAVAKKYDVLYERTGEKFNIFNILGVEEQEIYICRFMRELLSPSGSHGQKALFLRLFDECVLKLGIPRDELEDAEVSCEYYTANGRRIDIAIVTQTYFITIEAKINAEDSEAQLFDYYKEAKRNSDKAEIFYLTPDGREPSYESKKGIDVKTISFRRDILLWLSECLRDLAVIRIAPIREVLLQFSSAIRTITNPMEDTKTMELKELILKSTENLMAAVDIVRIMGKAVKDVRKDLILAVRDKLSAEGIECFKDDGKINCALQYRCGISGFAVSMGCWGNSTYVGYMQAEKGATMPEGFARKLKAGRGGSSTKWWPYYENCIVEEKGSPNLHASYPNEAACALLNDEVFHVFVDHCAEKTKTLLEFSPE